MMKFEEFKEAVKENILGCMPEDFEGATVTIKEVVKTNDVKLSGLTVLKKGAVIAPTIYLEPYYEAFQKGEMSIDEAVNHVGRLIVENTPNGADKFANIVECVSDFEYVKPRLYAVLVNTETNMHLIEENHLICRKFLDLTIIYKIMVSNEDEVASISVSEQLLSIWNDVTEEDVYNLAMENTPKLLPPAIHDMNEMISEFEEDDEMLQMILQQMESIPAEERMYVVTNKQKMHGASSIITSDILKMVSEKVNSDLWILPSSIHEVIVVSSNKFDNPKSLKKMVAEVNENSVPAEEVLSGSIYHYCAETGEITIYNAE